MNPARNAEYLAELHSLKAWAHAQLRAPNGTLELNEQTGEVTGGLGFASTDWSPTGKAQDAKAMPDLEEICENAIGKAYEAKRKKGAKAFNVLAYAKVTARRDFVKQLNQRDERKNRKRRLLTPFAKLRKDKKARELIRRTYTALGTEITDNCLCGERDEAWCDRVGQLAMRACDLLIRQLFPQSEFPRSMKDEFVSRVGNYAKETMQLGGDGWKESIKTVNAGVGGSGRIRRGTEYLSPATVFYEKRKLAGLKVASFSLQEIGITAKLLNDILAPKRGKKSPAIRRAECSYWLVEELGRRPKGIALADLVAACQQHDGAYTGVFVKKCLNFLLEEKLVHQKKGILFSQK